MTRLPGLDFEADLEESIECLRANAPADGRPYYGCFSGGKDSVALKHVARMAGVAVDWHYNVTTIDPPELVRFIQRAHPDVKWLRSPHGPFFRRAAEVKGFPTRRTRWCCAEYKECHTAPPGQPMLMGIRAQESSARAARWGMVTARPDRGGATMVNPLLHWDAADLWSFIRGEAVPYPSLYDEGFARLGCVGCPMNTQRARDLDRWPRFRERWRYVFRRTWERRTGSVQRAGRRWFGDRLFADWEAMWEWWLSNRPLPPVGERAQQELRGNGWGDEG